MRLPVALDTVPQDLLSAVETGQFGPILATTSVLDNDPVRAALHVWALAAQAETGVFIDDVPADSGCAALYWQVIQSGIPASDDNDAFDGDLDRLVAQADTLARQIGVKPASDYVPERPVTSRSLARLATGHRGDTAGTIYHLAARLARAEGEDHRVFFAKGAISFASAGQWERCRADLETVLSDADFCGSSEGNPLAHEATWALLGASVLSANQGEVLRHWLAAIETVPGFPKVAANSLPLLQYALKMNEPRIGRVVLATIDADQGQNRHFYESAAAQIVLTAARKAYRKRLFGLF